MIPFVLLIIGILDQTSLSFVPPYDSLKEEYLIDEKFINDIEAIMPENALIFQLPYVPFPEYPPVNRMSDYSHFRAYLHSKDLRWSYGAMKGRPENDWQKIAATMPADDMLNILSEMDFQGIYIDCYGFEDNGAKMISDIKQILEIEPLISSNWRLYFFDLTEFNKRKITNSSETNLIRAAFNSGWHEIEDWSGCNSRWMQGNGTIMVFSPENCTTILSLQALSFYRNRTLEIYSGGSLVGSVVVPPNFINVSVPIHLVRGLNTICLQIPEGCERPCDRPALNNPDSRCLSIAVQNLAAV